MRRSPAYIETPQIRLPPAVNISHQNIRRVHSEHTQNFIYPSLKCKWQIHTKLLAPNDLISLSYRTQYCVWNDNVYYELKKIDWNILVLPDQCSRTFWAFSRYRYRDTMRGGGAFTVSDTLVGRGDLFFHSHSTLLVSGIIFTQLAFTISFISLVLFILQETKGLCLSIREKSRSEFFSPYFPSIL